jgi:hypothetical protein
MSRSPGETKPLRIRSIYALAGLAVAFTTFASAAVALPIGPPSMPPRIELAQAIIVVRHRHPWRVQRWHRWQSYGYWRPRLRPRSVMLRLKASECLQLADTARQAEPKRIHTELARSYEHLAAHAKRSEQDRR